MPNAFCMDVNVALGTCPFSQFGLASFTAGAVIVALVLKQSRAESCANSCLASEWSRLAHD
jgi:hypothetical protein